MMDTRLGIYLGLALIVAVALLALFGCASGATIAAWTAESDRQTVWCSYHTPACWAPTEQWFPAYLADNPDGFRLAEGWPAILFQEQPQ